MSKISIKQRNFKQRYGMNTLDENKYGIATIIIIIIAILIMGGFTSFPSGI